MTGSRVPSAVNSMSNQPISGSARATCWGAGGLGQELRAEADAHRRHPRVEQRGEDHLLVGEPWILGLLVGVHGASEREHCVVRKEIARRVLFGGNQPLVELPATRLRLVGEDAGTGIRLVDDREGFQWR